MFGDLLASMKQRYTKIMCYFVDVKSLALQIHVEFDVKRAARWQSQTPGSELGVWMGTER